MKDVYVQFASFSRELMEDFRGSLEKIAKMGYTGVELFNHNLYRDYSAKELRSFMDSLGLTMISAHVNV